ncbi:MAG: NAD(+)/NADH kinase [Actinomycetota bacterium]|nr:NAD(+)/NADH kinase [Actinomycetota bacterium]
MTTVGFVIHGGRPAAVEAARDLVAWLSHQGVASRSLIEDRLDADEVTGLEGFPAGLGLVVSVGGDGTFLRAAYQALRAGCPVLGVNVGRMGFLTEVDPPEAIPLLERAIAGVARVDDRLAVVAEPERGTDWSEPQWGLNEVMVEKGARHRVVRLAVFFDGDYVTTFSGDGVIVATPTGSTAYSFSARGPIVNPSVECLVVTPIAAHMVFDRSFVLGAGEHVTIEVLGEEQGLLSADGRASMPLPVGSRVRVRAADQRLRMVRKEAAGTFYGKVRDRFHLPDERDLGRD